MHAHREGTSFLITASLPPAASSSINAAVQWMQPPGQVSTQPMHVEGEDLSRWGSVQGRNAGKCYAESLRGFAPSSNGFAVSSCDNRRESVREWNGWGLSCLSWYRLFAIFPVAQQIMSEDIDGAAAGYWQHESSNIGKKRTHPNSNFDDVRCHVNRQVIRHQLTRLDRPAAGGG
jgi:hypothetical protein